MTTDQPIECVVDRPVDIAASALTAPLNEGLATVVISPPGEVRSLVGTWVMDAPAADMVIASFQRQGNDLVVDFDHASEGGPYAPPDGIARAAGWIKQIWYDPARGLLGLASWNERARELIRANEFKYLSPALVVRVSDRRPVRLKSIALTNVPATPNAETIAASGKTLLYNPNTEALTAMADAPAAGMTERLIGEIKAALAAKGVTLADTASRDDVLKAALAALKGGDAKEGAADNAGGADDSVEASARKALGLDADAPTSAVLVALGEVRLMRDDYATLKASASGASADAETRRVDDLIAKHVREGRIREADTEDVSACRRLASENEKLFESMMARREVPPQGRTVKGDEAFDERQTVIASAKADFHSDKSAQGLTTLTALANQRLADKGLSKLTDDEAKAL